MHAYRVPLNLRAHDDWIEFLVVQWGVPTPADLIPIPPDWVAAKRAIVEQLRRYLHSNPSVGTRFVVFPEISVPLSMREDLENELLPRGDYPWILIAGLEHINRTAHTELTAACAGEAQGCLAYSTDEATRFYNDALVTVWNGRDMQRYVQPKRRSWEEEPQLNHCEDVLAFDLGPQDAPFTFCVQICSDFNSPADVELLRKATRDAGIVDLDLTVLIEHNEWQFNDHAHPHLKNALAGYFTTEGATLARTAGSFVLLVNRPQETRLSGAFGGSGLVFNRGQWTPRSHLFPSTYFWEEDRALSLEHAFFRVQGPSIHRFSYRRRGVTHAGPGLQQQSPFRDSLMTTARIAGAGPELRRTLLRRFCEISPFDEALRRVLSRSAASLRSEFSLAGIHRDVSAKCLQQHYRTLAALNRGCRSSPTQAVTSISAFLGTPGPHPRSEDDPAHWTEVEEGAVGQLAHSHALLELAAEGNAVGTVRLALANTSQARLNDAADIAYVWCNGTDRTGGALVRWVQRDAVTPVAEPVVLVGVGADLFFTAERVARLYGEEITRSATAGTNGHPYFAPQGTVTASGLQRPRVSYISSHALTAALQPGNGLAATQANLGTELQRCMNEIGL